MMSIFRRLFNISKAETHAVVDKLEDPIRMTEQGIRDLKRDLQEALSSLAQVKAIAIRTRRSADAEKKGAADYERKAMLLLQRAKDGHLDLAEADRLAADALSAKERHATEAVRLSKEAERHEQMTDQLQSNVNKIKSSIATYENDLATLRARAKTAAATRKINQQLAKIDTSGTIAMLERMKARVEEDEALATAYGEIASADKSVDAEIDAVLGGQDSAGSSQALLEMKKKLGMA